MSKLDQQKESLKKIVDDLTLDDTGIVIQWDRTSNDFRLFFHGRPIHISSLEALLKGVVSTAKKQLDSDGFVNASTVEEPEEDDNLPPWMN